MNKKINFNYKFDINPISLRFIKNIFILSYFSSFYNFFLQISVKKETTDVVGWLNSRHLVATLLQKVS